MNTEERLEKLEKELAGAKRRSRVVLVGAAMVAALVFLLGASGDTVQKVVRAERFELVDTSGAVRATLRMSDTGGGPVLSLYDQNGKPCVLLDILADGTPGLGLYDQNGEPRAVLGVLNDQPWLALGDRSGNPHVMLGVSDSGPELSLLDQNGKCIWHAP